MLVENVDTMRFVFMFAIPVKIVFLALSYHSSGSRIVRITFELLKVEFNSVTKAAAGQSTVA